MRISSRLAVLLAVPLALPACGTQEPSPSAAPIEALYETPQPPLNELFGKELIPDTTKNEANFKLSFQVHQDSYHVDFASLALSLTAGNLAPNEGNKTYAWKLMQRADDANQNPDWWATYESKQIKTSAHPPQLSPHHFNLHLNADSYTDIPLVFAIKMLAQEIQQEHGLLLVLMDEQGQNIFYLDLSRWYRAPAKP